MLPVGVALRAHLLAYPPDGVKKKQAQKWLIAAVARAFSPVDPGRAGEEAGNIP